MKGFLSQLKKWLKKQRNKILKKISPTYKTVSSISSRVTAIENKQMAMFWYSLNQPGESMSDTKKRFFRNMPKAEGVVREVQEIVNEILLEMDRVCRQNDIKYWIMGGTLIGAIRHAGFIPWDDDGDVGMMRQDYERLKAALDGNPLIELKEFYNNSGCYRIPKLTIRGTDEKLDVDIVVFDYANRGDKTLSKTWAEQKVIRRQCVGAIKRHHLKILKYRNTFVFDSADEKAAMDKIIDSYVAKCGYLPDDGDTVIWGVDNFTSKAPDPERLYKKEAIFPLGEMEFEGHMYYVVSDYMDMITREAGDIWTLPKDVGKPKFFSDAQLREMVDRCNQAREINHALQGGQK